MMKKRIFSLLLALVLCLSLVDSVFAQTVTKSGHTVGADGNYATMDTMAKLSCSLHEAYATTTATDEDEATITTYVTFYYMEGTSRKASVGSGETRAHAYCNYSDGLEAESTHIVDGDKKWGLWTANLSANAS